MKNVEKIWSVVLVLALLFSSCKKDVVINGNVPPPDHTIDSSTVLTYINKCYIDILSREPVGDEKANALTVLRQNNFTASNRLQFLDTLFTKSGYNQNLYNIARTEYLRNTDSADIASQIFVFQNALTQPQFSAFWAQIQIELNRLDTLNATLHDMNSGTLDYRGMLKRCVNNYFYDQINMGTENFVVSTFQNFLFRYPSSAELTSGKTMVDGQSATLFLQIGQKKNDYINIFFNADDYYEGQVRFIFKKYLLFISFSPAD